MLPGWLWGEDDGEGPSSATGVYVEGARRGLPTLYLSWEEQQEGSRLGEAIASVLPGCLECADLGGLQQEVSGQLDPNCQ